MYKRKVRDQCLRDNLAWAKALDRIGGLLHCPRASRSIWSGKSIYHDIFYLISVESNHSPTVTT